MKTLDQELTELRRKFIDDEEKLRKKYDILQVVQERIPNILEYRQPFVFNFTLYGSVGNIHFSFRDYILSTDKDKDCDKELFKQVIEAFPSIRKVKVKESGCTSFRPDETLEEKEGMSLYDCYDKTVRISPPKNYSSGRLSTEWYTKIGYQIWKIEFDSKWHLQGLGDYRIIYDRSNSVYEQTDYSIKSCTFTPKYDGQIIKYASTDRRTPNDFIVYWDKDSGEKINFPEVMFEKEKK